MYHRLMVFFDSADDSNVCDKSHTLTNTLLTLKKNTSTYSFKKDDFHLLQLFILNFFKVDILTFYNKIFDFLKDKD